MTPFHFFFHDFRSFVPPIADGRGGSTDFGLFRFSAAVRQHPSGASSAPSRASFILRPPSHSLEFFEILDLVALHTRELSDCELPHTLLKFLEILDLVAPHTREL